MEVPEVICVVDYPAGCVAAKVELLAGISEDWELE